MNAAKDKFEHLPTNIVPPEIIRPLPVDKLLDNNQIQTSATPVATPRSVEDAVSKLDVIQPNGVRCERRVVHRLLTLEHSVQPLLNICYTKLN